MDEKQIFAYQLRIFGFKTSDLKAKMNRVQVVKKKLWGDKAESEAQTEGSKDRFRKRTCFNKDWQQVES